jgi:hypothetical protein
VHLHRVVRRCEDPQRERREREREERDQQ